MHQAPIVRYIVYAPTNQNYNQVRMIIDMRFNRTYMLPLTLLPSLNATLNSSVPYDGNNYRNPNHELKLTSTGSFIHIRIRG